LILNNVPTGVEVTQAMNHGGPFPATTDSRFTSVGTSAILRFVRPLSYQNFPDDLLPDALKDNNPLGIWRKVNGILTK
jgi:NADP-dependent aldehyde dehydrogenase